MLPIAGMHVEFYVEGDGWHRLDFIQIRRIACGKKSAEYSTGKKAFRNVLLTNVAVTLDIKHEIKVTKQSRQNSVKLSPSS